MALGLDEAAGESGWGRRMLTLAWYGWYAVPSTFLAWNRYKAGRVLSQAFVAIGPDGVRLRRRKGVMYLLPEQRFKWEEIGDIACNGAVCRFRAGGHLYTLEDANSPSPRTVAQLMAEWKGVGLPDRESTAAPGKRGMPRLTQAAILGGISLVLISIVVAGGLWLYRHTAGPYYEAEFGALGLIGLAGGVLFFTAGTLVFIEINHRV